MRSLGSGLLRMEIGSRRQQKPEPRCKSKGTSSRSGAARFRFAEPAGVRQHGRLEGSAARLARQATDELSSAARTVVHRAGRGRRLPHR